MRSIVIFFSLALLPLCLSHCVSGSSSGLDTTFGNNGEVTLDFGGQDEIHALAVQSDGRLVAAGKSNAGTHGDDFAIARFNTDGSLDTSFHATGKLLLDFSGGNDTIYSLAVQSDGKIVAGGVSVEGNNGYFALARINSDGSLDTSFGTTGQVILPISSQDQINAIALQPDGKIVAAGFTTSNSVQTLIIARFLSTGSLDTSFGSNGTAVVAAGTTQSAANAVIVLSSGGILAAGSAQTGANNMFAIVRLKSDGSLDTSLGGTGTTTATIGKVDLDIFSSDVAYGVAMDSQNRILAVGTSTLSGVNSIALARFTSSGSLDSGFNSTGKVISSFGSTKNNSTGLAINLTPNGAILVAGTYSGATDDFGLARFNTLGGADSTLNATGVLTADFNSSQDEAYSMVRQSSTQTVVGGRTFNGSNFDFALVRYNQ